MQSPGPRSTIQVILNEHGQLSAAIVGMLRFIRLLETRERSLASWCFGQCFITSGSGIPESAANKPVTGVCAWLGSGRERMLGYS